MNLNLTFKFGAGYKVKAKVKLYRNYVIHLAFDHHQDHHRLLSLSHPEPRIGFRSGAEERRGYFISYLLA